MIQATVDVLLVDDDRAFADRTATELAAADDRLDVDTAVSVDAALSALAKEPYDCVVAEYALSDGDGLELVEAIRDRHGTVPVIVYTDHGSESLAGDAIAAGVDGYLQKAGDNAAELATRILAVVDAATDETSEQVEALYERISDGVFIVDENWRYTYVNSAAVELVDRDAEDLLGQRVWDAFGGLADSPFAEALRTAMEERQERTVDAHFPPLDRHFDVTAYPSGSGIAIVFRDVSDRSQQLTTLRRLHAVASELFKEPDPDRATSLCVDAIADVLEYPLNGVWLHERGTLEPVAATGTERVDQVPPTFPAGDSLAWDVFERGESRVFGDVSTEAEVYNPETVIRSEMIVPVGRFGVIIVSSRDVDAFEPEDTTFVELVAYHLEASLERAEHERRLEHERNRFEAAFDTVPEPAVHVVLDDNAPIIHRVNEAFVQTFGIDAEAAIGQSVDELIVPESDADTADELNESVRESDRYEAEVVRETVDGTRPFLFTAKQMPTAGDDSDPIEAVATYVDLSDQVEREAELTRQNERLERFADVLSHDIPNHLSVAAGHLELAEETGELAYLDRVADAHDRIETLLSDMQVLVETGSPIDSIEPVRLSAVAESCWASCCSPEDPQAMVVATDGRFLADRTRLTQLLENLFWNACTHAGDDITVTVSLTADGFAVEDDGQGIPPDISEEVFETGYTTSSAGTGFGLAIVREIAQAHGWDIDLTESDAGGARFVLSGVNIVERFDD